MILNKLLIPLLLFGQLGLVHLLATSANNSQQNNTTNSIDLNDENLAMWQSHLKQISGNINRKLCTCDLTVHYCDINCCCDDDCGQMDKYAFHRCQLENNDEQSNLCQSRQHIFNRKRFHSAQSSRLLCLARDNTGQHQLFTNKNAIMESGKLSSIKSKHYFKWAGNNHLNWVTNRIGIQNDTLLQVKSILEYQSGKAIVRSYQQNGSIDRLDYWQLPSTVNGKCNRMRHVNYMYNFTSSCLLMLHHFEKTCTESLNLEYYYKSIFFFYYDFLSSEFKSVPVELLSNYSKVHFDPSKTLCHNAVTQFDYTVWHKGIFGITRVSLKVHQIDVSNSSRSIQQKFNVKFKWTKNESEHFSLSGNPGYIRKKRLLFAEHTVNQSFVLVQKRLVSIYRHGLCNLSQEISTNEIRFGINQLTSCRLRSKLVTGKQHICTELAKVIGNYSDQNWSNLFVATFGNITRSPEQSAQWLQVSELPSLSETTKLDNVGCSNLSRGVSLEVYVAKVGSREQAQHTILGATFRRVPLTGMRVNCSSERCTASLDTDLVSSVDFIDVTELPRPNYAPAPAVKIELPNDFFYPFQTSSACSIANMIYSLVVIGLLVIVSVICTKQVSMFY